jgi:hypothetical protein
MSALRMNRMQSLHGAAQAASIREGCVVFSRMRRRDVQSFPAQALSRRRVHPAHNPDASREG